MVSTHSSGGFWHVWSNYPQPVVLTGTGLPVKPFVYGKWLTTPPKSTFILHLVCYISFHFVCYSTGIHRHYFIFVSPTSTSPKTTRFPDAYGHSFADYYSVDFFSPQTHKCQTSLRRHEPPPSLYEHPHEIAHLDELCFW